MPHHSITMRQSGLEIPRVPRSRRSRRRQVHTATSAGRPRVVQVLLAVVFDFVPLNESASAGPYSLVPAAFIAFPARDPVGVVGLRGHRDPRRYESDGDNGQARSEK